MDVPERYWRFPTGVAIDALAARFGLRNEPGMQDWEYQVADAARLPEFRTALEGGALTDDERFTLGESVMQCFEDLTDAGCDGPAPDEWARFAALLRARPSLHAFTLCYWSSGFRVSGRVSPLWAELEPTLVRPAG